MKIRSSLFFALIAVFGNAVFTAGQKKAVVVENTRSFIIISLLVCVSLIILLAPLFGPTNYTRVIKENWLWAVASGVGLFLTYLGFNLLYTPYGASNYILYAVLSIITTSLIVGVGIFEEALNFYHWVVLVGSIKTVIPFTIVNSVGEI